MKTTRHPGLLRSARIFLALFTLQTALATGPAWAQLTAAPNAPAGQKPLIDAAANGVPIVHIAPPSAGGVSRNQYQQFNVGGNGLILNNSTGNVLTQQGGWITGNLQIGLTPARIILNEVVGPDASQLRGTIEVAGQRADIVIANPNGIRCDGCGFLNTAGRTSLVAGQVQFGEQGTIDSFQTGTGRIEVGAAGLNAAEQDRLDLIARGIVIEGEVWSRNLSVIAGRNHVLYGTLEAMPQAGSAPGAPLFAVDIKQLGGMYANQIYMLATEKGLGVNSTGRTAALQGNLVLSAQGDLSLHDSYAKGEVKLDAQGKVTLTGQTIAETDVRIAAPSGLVNRGAAQAAGQLVIAAPTVTNHGSLVQQGTSDFVIDAAQGVANSGTIYAPGGVRVTTSSLTGQGGQLLAGGQLTVNADAVGVSGQTIAANGRVRVSSGDMAILGSSLQSGRSLRLDSSGRLDVSGSSLDATGGATLTGRDVSADGARLSSPGDISLRATGTVSAQQARMASNSSIDVTGARIALEGSGFSAQRQLDIRAGDGAALNGAEALAGRQIVIQAEGVNTAAATVSAPLISIEAGAGALDNAAGKLFATSDAELALQVGAVGVNNTGGEIRSNGGLILDVRGGKLDNTGGIVAGQTGTLTGVASLINRRGVLYTTSDLNLPANGLDNSQGTIVSAGSLSIVGNGQAIQNNGGTLQAGGSLTLSSGTGAIDSAGGTLIAGGPVSVAGGAVDLSDAIIAAAGDAGISARTLDAAGATISANGTLDLVVQAGATFAGATAHSGEALTVSAGAIQSEGAQIASAAQLQVKAASVQGGTWSAAGDASIATSGTTDLSGGGLIAGGTSSVRAQGINTSGGVVSGTKVNLDAGAGAVTNNGGTIVADGTDADALRVKGAGIDNSDGSLISAGGAVLDAGGLTLNNTNGTVQIAGVLDIRAGELLNRGGTLSTGSSISIRSQSLDNTGGTFATRGNLSINTSGQLLDNTGGRLLAEGDIRVDAGELRNSGGAISANGATAIHADTLDTSNGRISGTRSLDVLVARSITGNDAQFATEGALDISAQSISASQASIRGDAGVTVRALQGALTAVGAQVSAGGAMTLQATDAVTLDAARLQSNGDMQLAGSSVAAAALQAQTLNRLILNAANGPAVLNGAALIAGQTMDIGARGIAAQGADFAAVGNVGLEAGTGALDANDIRVRSQTGSISVNASQVTAAASKPVAAGVDPDRGFTAAGDLRITAGTGAIDLGHAAAAAGGNVDLLGAGALSTRGSRVAAGGNANLTGTTLDNEGGRIEAAGTVSATLSDGLVNNNAGRIATPGVLTLQGTNGAALTALSNRAGAIQTAGSLDLNLQSFDNREGSVLALGTLAVRGGPIDTRDGVLAARGDLQLDSAGAAFEGAGSRIVSEQGSISLQAGPVQLDAALLQAAINASLAGTQLGATGAIVSAQTGDLALSFASGSAALNQAQLLAGGALALHAGQTSLERSRVSSGAGLTISATGDVQLRGAAVDAQRALAISAGGSFDASGALIAAGDAATLNAGSGISITAGRLTATSIALDGGNGAVDNTAGVIAASGTGALGLLRIAGQGFANAGGLVSTGGDLSLDAKGGAIDNNAGSLQAAGAASLRGTGLDNRAGDIAANGAITIQANVADAQAVVDNAGGSIRSAQGSLSLRGGTIRNAANEALASGQIVAAQNISLDASGAIDNTGALIAAGGDVTLNATGNVSNRQGLIQAGGGVSLRSAALDNREGQILAGGGNLSLATTGITGAAGVIAASGKLTIAAGSGAVDVSNASLSSGGDMSLSGGATNITAAQLVTDGALSVTGSSLQAAGADVQATGSLTLKAGVGPLDAAGSTLLSGQSLSLTGGAITLRDAQVAANDSVTVRGSNIDATGAEIQALNDVSVVTGGTLNFGGASMVAGRDLEARGTGAGTSAGAKLLAGRDLSIGNGLYFDFNATDFQYQYSRDLTVRAQGISNVGNEVFARNLTLDAGGGLVDNTGGTLNASGNLNLSGDGLANQGGEVAANGSVIVDAGSGAVDNRSGAIYSTGSSVTLAGGAIDNSGGVLAASSVTASAATVNNAAGVISGLDLVSLTGALNNDAGVVEAGGGGIAIDTRGGQLLNTNSGSYRGIVSSGNIAIAAGAIDNQGGYIGASGALTVSQSSSIDNRLGTLTGVGAVTLNSTGLVDNRAGSITSNGDVSITAGSLNNGGASVVFAGHDLAVTAGSIDNSNTKDGSWKLGLLAGNNLSLTAGTIDNTNGAIVALGDATVRATGSLTNTGGQIAGNTVTIQTPSFTNTGGRVDAQQALTALVPQFSADGVLASSGSLTLQTTGDYVNDGTVVANNDLIVSTTGSYTNNGTLSAQRNLTLSANSLDNNTGAQIISQATTLNVAGTVNNAGLINSSAGTTTINAATVNNTGRIYGDALALNADINNAGGAAIASRAGDIAIRGNVTNTGLSDLVSLGSLSVQGNLTNENATIDVSGSMSVSGKLSNLNAGFTTQTQSISESVSELSIRPNYDTTTYAVADMGWSNASPGYYVLPSTTYPIAQFGSERKELSWTQANCNGSGENFGCDLIATYSADDPVWALFNVAPPGPAPTTTDPSGCIAAYGDTNSTQRSTTTECTAYWTAYDAYTASSSATYAELDAKITAFNVDVESRWLIDWFEREITSRESIKPVVATTQPGVIRVGGNLTAGAGSVNKDSAIVAGGTAYVEDGTTIGGIQNIASKETQTSTEYGQERESWRTWSGGFSQSYSREYTLWSPISGGTVTKSVPLNTLTAPNRPVAGASNTLAGSAPSAQVPTPGAVAGGARSVNPTTGTPQGGTISGASGPGVQVDTTTTAAAPTVVAGVQPDNGAVTGAGSTSPTSATITNGTVTLDAAADVPLPGSVIATGVRAGQLQAIEAVRTSFAEQAATRPLVTVSAEAAAPIQAAPALVKALGYRTVTSTAPLQAPASQLFRLSTAPGARYLVETDPAFTGYRQFLSSEWMLTQLSLDPERNLKRYGDGFAEQRLIDDQIFALTGQRFLSGYASTEAQFQALMNAGVMFAQRFQLTPGVALSAEQMAALTSDIVWLELQTVLLPDGSTALALVPKVYLRRPVAGDINPTGAIISASSINLRSPSGDVTNSGTLYAWGEQGAVNISAANVNNSGTLAGNRIGVQASGDINQIGGQTTGLGTGSVVRYEAGGNIVLQTTTQASSQSLAGAYGSTEVSRTNVDRVATIAGDSIVLAALGNIDMAGASVNASTNLAITATGTISAGAVQERYSIDIPLGGSLRGKTGGVAEATLTNVGTSLSSGGNLSVNGQGVVTLIGSTVNATGTVAIAGQNVVIDAAKDFASFEQSFVKPKAYDVVGRSDETLSGGTVSAGGNVIITAREDINATGAVISSSDGLAALIAGRDVVVQNATTEHTTLNESYDSNKGFLSSKSTLREASSATTQVVGSTLSGATVSVVAGHDIDVQGSTIVSDTRTLLSAGHDVNITAATETQSGSSFVQQTKSGLGALGGLSYGTRLQSTDQDNTATRAVASTVGSLAGNVTITAGNQYSEVGSHVVAPEGDVDIVARRVSITEARETTGSQTEQLFKQSGISVSVSNPILNALQTVGQMGRVAGRTDDGRAQALAVATAGLAVHDAATAIVKDPAAATSVGININLGTSRSQTNSSEQSNSAAGSTVAAGGNVTIIATGDGKQSDITVQGSNISAGNNATLLADGKVNLLAAQNTSGHSSTNSSSSASIGVGINVGSQSGLSFNASASRANGSADGSDVTWTNTHLTAGNTLTVQSGSDTNLIGAVIAANAVKGDVGGNLNVESLQDTSTYTSKQTSSGGGMSLCIPPLCYGASSISANVGKANAQGDFASVIEQSGIKAGDGGFQLNVTGNTDLKGGVLASTDAAIQSGKNSLVTATLTQSDIQNRDNYSASGYSVGVSFSGAVGDQSSAAPGAEKAAADAATNAKPGGSAGIGSASGNQASTTVSGISGGAITIINGVKQQELTGMTAAETVAATNRAVTTGQDTSGAIVKARNGGQLITDVQAQAEITAAFGSAASSAWGKFANEQLANAKTDEVAACWSANGACRVAGHSVIGALGGGVAGALGTGLSTSLTPIIAQSIKDAGVTGGAADALTTAIASGIGAVAGGAAGAAGAYNEVRNNYLTSTQWQALADKRKACGSNATCVTGVNAEYSKLSALQDNALATCDIRGDCAMLIRQVSDGARTQLQLVQSGALPDGFMGAANLQQLGERLAADPALRTQVSQSITAAYVCETNPAQCTKQAATAALGLTALVGAGAATGAIAVNATRIASAAGLAVESCLANVIYCVNKVGLTVADLLAGEALGGATITAGAGGAAVVAGRVGSEAAEVAAAGKAAGAATGAVSAAWKPATVLSSSEADALIAGALPKGVVINGSASADIKNAAQVADGWKPPYIPGTQIVEITTTQPTSWVRMYVPMPGQSPQAGSWIMRAEDVAGLSAEQIASKYSLPQIPTMMTEVRIPSGTRLSVSAANNILMGSNGGGGGVQFQILNRPSSDLEFGQWFANPRPLQ